MKGSPSHVVAACFGMTAFTIAIVAGLSSDTPAHVVLTRSVFAMIACYPLGLVVGVICERVIQSHLDSVTGSATEEEQSATTPVEGPSAATEEVTVV